jgi:hypothetical protein
MSHTRHTRVATAVAAVALSLCVTTGAASAAVADRTPPSPPLFGYAQGFQCLTLYIGVGKSTDNVTPQDQIAYEVFADGVLLGPLVDLGNGPWATLKLRHTGPNTVVVQAIDAAGNRSSSRPVVVTGYYGPACP